MVDLRVDTGAIRRSQATFSDIRDRLESAMAGFDSVSGASVAQEELRRRPEAGAHDEFRRGRSAPRSTTASDRS
ncbi:hypothetical protein [Microbacterium lacticum]|uniref:Uncharacterized protein n=1 Tax=Microbacterium lacticum TaxID=33885 RepID=A0A4Y3UM23_9MICO|nr:hypothetical protein [Microbacterium lacticum]TQM98864.1 hypothetical protein FHX68_1580 [Microbacterium lacticum]GEB94549.1 hypothetical protein MLA01_07680 [Microbacterium lacticum]GGN18238.1 hypothetical protein GCM10009724_10070 [Microbacterium lacticum]